ncbi:hypothetical protein OOZ15_04055 [Galbibacter sp. EGI 63066]|uniref:hypothetical protein n=1 Tax=Galbibacter sp. EGI 63066 TaxID=2993559 RepID=UPI00224905CA|nr:hypothetical protein [Galbibacter sp. EGI 63066]MCX2679105.1 hypothetical protein [Galbibacter sp. EGI 63066]
MSQNVQPNQNNPSEEIDLGQLFKLIGDGFRKFFNFIGNIFKGIFHLIISFLLFIQRHIIKFVIAGVVGIVVGVILDMKKEPKYISSMVVEPNFNSVQQLYNNINFYNGLVEAEDSVALSELLEIEVAEAASIKEIEIESYSDENQKLQLFDEFIRSLDTTTRKVIDMEAYLKNFNALDARFHNISIVATNSLVAKKTQPAIIKSISQNEYFNQQKNTKDENIELEVRVYNEQLTEIDSLQLLYKRVMEKEADKPLQGTNISLGEGRTEENKELALINKIDEIKQGLVQLNQERANKSNILNVISEFPRSGVERKGILRSYKFLITVALLGLVLLGLSILELNKFLKEYAKSKNQG